MRLPFGHHHAHAPAPPELPAEAQARIATLEAEGAAFLEQYERAQAETDAAMARLAALAAVARQYHLEGARNGTGR